MWFNTIKPLVMNNYDKWVIQTEVVNERKPMVNP